MTVKVSIIKPGAMGAIDAVAIGDCRVSELVTVPGTTTASLLEGEFFLVVSGESANIIGAHGATPDAAATAQTLATTAGYGIPPSMSVAIVGKKGDKLSLKAFA